MKPEPASIEIKPTEPEKAKAAAAAAAPARERVAYTPKTSAQDRPYPTLGYE